MSSHPIDIPNTYRALSNIHLDAYKCGIFVRRTSGNPNSLHWPLFKSSGVEVWCTIGFSLEHTAW